MKALHGKRISKNLTFFHEHVDNLVYDIIKHFVTRQISFHFCI